VSSIGTDWRASMTQSVGMLIELTLRLAKPATKPVSHRYEKIRKLKQGDEHGQA
jgi:hypothetical protein